MKTIRRSTVNNASCGFTLVELLLVLMILGILAALVVPSYTHRGEDARKTAAQTQISQFGAALDAFEVDNGFFPAGKDGLNALVSAPKDARHWNGPYLKGSVIPLDPWEHPYTYEAPGKNNTGSYDISSMGPDGQAGTGDDINNWTGGKVID